MRVALRYAKAIAGVAAEKNATTEVYNDMKLIVETINESTDLRTLLKSPLLHSNDKKAALEAIFNGKVNQVSLDLMQLLIENKRIDILDIIAERYISLADTLAGKQEATVTTAVALTAELEAQILAKVKEITGNEATLVSIVDPEVIGGFILRVGDVQFDATVASKLKALKVKFENNRYTA
ncbi:ATP synthase F1 subunit delta [Aureivirga sp. CE67]|uniref:ATP synthase F1 subunit delta n=1 Tax=Aureivirga sp. CE67 TaxID=1788983 RepID=UPI0018CAB994|nr:ATP synthase F1 subunit delta [Aureivirga sp. CE67]